MAGAGRFAEFRLNAGGFEFLGRVPAANELHDDGENADDADQ